MTHAESQDLLLDLAYGELPPERAAELEGHLAGCAECQREKAALDEARRLAAPLRELEEPSAGFDDRILAAARAQAQLEHGSLGKVIEVQGSVRPMELAPAQVDAHRAAVRETRRKPRWVVRAALGGSVAAAAALALVVTSSLQSKREVERVAQLAAAEKPYEIRVAPAPAVVAEAARDARKDDAAKAQYAPRQEAPAREEAAPKPPQLARAAKKSAPQQAIGGVFDDETRALDAPSTSREGGSGGDALGAIALKGAPVAAQPAQAASPPPASAKEPESANELAAARAPTAVGLSQTTSAAGAAHIPPPSKQEGRAAQAAEQKVAAANAPAVAELEKDAQEARHQGDYARAASLYRQAAAARGAGSAEGAWDLAHAVECLAAAGQFDDARQLRAELFQLHPAERTAQIAANHALRIVDVPGAADKVMKAKAAEPDAAAPAKQ